MEFNGRVDLLSQCGTQSGHMTYSWPPLPYAPHVHTVIYPKAHTGWLGWEKFQSDSVLIKRSSHLQKPVP